MISAARITSSLFAAAATSILIAAVAVTQAIANGAPMWLRLIFRPLCHGIPSRCFHMNGVPLPLCARCTGLYVGFLVGIALFAAFKKLQRELIPSWAVLLLIAPLVIDGLTQGLGLRESTNELRVYTGFVAGAAALAWVMNRINRSPLPVLRSRGAVESENGERRTENASRYLDATGNSV